MPSIMKASPLRSRAGRLILAAAVAGSLAVAQALPAFADAATPTNPKSTTMSLKIDETQITAVIPTDVPIAVQGDGTFVVPNPEKVALENQSVFSVHVAKVKAAVGTSPAFTLVQKGQSFADATSNDTLWMTVTAGTHELDLSTATGNDGVATKAGDWNMAGATTTDDTDKLALTLAGAVKNAKSLKSDAAATALTVQWTLAAGEVTAPVGP